MHRAAVRTVELTDAEGTLSVSVPASWTSVESLDGWTPPGAENDQPALSAGSRARWREDGDGVFVGLIPALVLPTEMPQHPECGDARPVSNNTVDGAPQRTVTYVGCPGYIVERVLQVTTDRLLWVQVRSDDRATANRVLDSVSTFGL